MNVDDIVLNKIIEVNDFLEHTFTPEIDKLVKIIRILFQRYYINLDLIHKNLYTYYSIFQSEFITNEIIDQKMEEYKATVNSPLINIISNYSDIENDNINDNENDNINDDENNNINDNENDNINDDDNDNINDDDNDNDNINDDEDQIAPNNNILSVFNIISNNENTTNNNNVINNLLNNFIQDLVNNNNISIETINNNIQVEIQTNQNNQDIPIVLKNEEMEKLQKKYSDLADYDKKINKYCPISQDEFESEDNIFDFTM